MILNLYHNPIIQKKIVLENIFSKSHYDWELIDDAEEKSWIDNGCYYMQNKSKNRWMFYHKKMPLQPNNNFIITAEIEVLKHQGYGQYGLVWGFNAPHQQLNKFTVSVNQSTFSVAKFEKNYHHYFHRFSDVFKKNTTQTNPQIFTIVCLNAYCYFYLNHSNYPLYICHKAHLTTEGNRFGFYIEPGITIRCYKISISKLLVDSTNDINFNLPLATKI